MSELNVEIAKAKDLLTSTKVRLRDYLASIQVIEQREQFDTGLISRESGGISEEAKSPLAQFQADTSNHVDLFILYELFIERERLIYVTLNKFRAEASHLLLGFCWIPSRHVDKAMR